MNSKHKPRFCQKLRLKDDTVLLGLVKSENDGFVSIKTANGEHLIAKSEIVRISSTDIKFKGKLL